MSGPDTNLARAARLDTATLSDALDRLGLIGQCSRIRPCGEFRLAGRAWTLRYGPAGNPPGTVGDYIDDVPEGHVVALDNLGREDATVWGDILTEIAHRRALGGTVINGINRDVHLCRTLGYPIYSRGSWMRTGKDRVQVEEVGGAIDMGGVRVLAGDLLIGDADGLIAIPAAVEDRLLDVAEEIHAAEERIREACRGGMRLDEARKANRYHQLQTRQTAE